MAKRSKKTSCISPPEQRENLSHPVTVGSFGRGQRGSQFGMYWVGRDTLTTSSHSKRRPTNPCRQKKGKRRKTGMPSRGTTILVGPEKSREDKLWGGTFDGIKGGKRFSQVSGPEKKVYPVLQDPEGGISTPDV